MNKEGQTLRGGGEAGIILRVEGSLLEGIGETGRNRKLANASEEYCQSSPGFR